MEHETMIEPTYYVRHPDGSYSEAAITQDEWYERERAAFIAWWESEGQVKFGATTTLAAGAGWFAKAEAVRSETRPTRQVVATFSKEAVDAAYAAEKPLDDNHSLDIG